MCSSYNYYNLDERCSIYKAPNEWWTFLIKVIPYEKSGIYATGTIKTYKECSEGWLDEYKCEWGDTRYRKYRYSDCSTEWQFVKDCDDKDYDGSWTKYCRGDDVRESKTEYEGYCSAGQRYLDDNSKDNFLSSVGDGDYCSDANGLSCACTRNDYDCDWNNECYSGTYCKGEDWSITCWGFECGCCNSNEKWSNHQCIANCESQDYSQCYNGDRYWYNSCGSRGDTRQNCGGKGCLNDACLECSNDGHCGTNKKCVNNQCADKTCSDYGRIKSCNILESGNTYCHPEEPNGDPAKCEQVGNVYCYRFIDSCENNEYCRDPTFGGGAECIPYQCEISSSYWSKETAVHGENVDLIATGSNCDGKIAAFQIWESDCPGFDFSSMENSTFEEQDIVASNFTTQNLKDYCFGSHLVDTITDGSFSNGEFRATWRSVYESDILGKPDYYFNVIIDSSEKSSSNNYLRVSEACYDNDGDGYGNPASGGCSHSERDCSDNNAEINPGRNEICDGGDNNCNGNTDENNICSSNVCNDNDYESYDTGCDQEQEMECRDIYHKSTAYEFSGINSEKADYCSDYNTVNEAFIRCFDGLVFDDTMYQAIDCPNGYVCSDGACVLETCDYNCVGSCIPDNNREGGCFSGDVMNGICGEGLTCCNKQLIVCPVVCGDGVCDNGETCDQDCYSDIILGEITGIYPVGAKENEIVTFTVEVKNNGTNYGAKFIEAGIVPEFWAGIVYPNTYRYERIYDNPFPVCPLNNYYDSKIVELEAGETNYAVFSMRVPNKNSVDECDPNRRSAWDDKFRLIAGTYGETGGGDYEKFVSKDYFVVEDFGVCDFPYGTSSFCSCNLIGCPNYYRCDMNLGYGTCVEAEECDIPDGSGPLCECDSDNDCPDEFVCELGPGDDACVEYTEPDECGVIDEYVCKHNDVYRCEEIAGRKKLVLADMCTNYEACPNNVGVVKECVSLLEYDLSIEKASSGVIVNKQRGDTVILNVNVNNNVHLDFEYDSNAFSFVNGNCLDGIFDSGDNICEFRVTGGNGRYGFKAGDDLEVVEIISDPYAVYVTNFEQLHKRFSDKDGVDVLLAKTYEKSYKNKGVVYDLGFYIDSEHPFSSSYSLYNQRLSPFGVFDNLYAIEVSKFVKNKCISCKETIIVGDDYVVPSYRRSAGFEGGIELFTLWDLFGNYETETYYTDMQMVKKEANLNLADLQDVFNEWDGENYISRTTVMIVPSNLDEDMRLAVDRFKITLMEKFGNEIEEISGEGVGCDTFAHYTYVRSSLVIIGNEDNNDVLRCFPSDFSENSMYISKNVWDSEEYAFILNTMDSEILSFYSMFIAFEEYKNIQAPGMSVWDKIALGVGTTAIVVGIISTSTGVGAIVGVPLTYIGYVIDAAIITDECYLDNKGGHNWLNCGISVGAFAAGELGGELISKLIKQHGADVAKLISKNVNKMMDYFNPKSINLFLKNSDNLADSARKLSVGINVISRNSDEMLDLAIKQIPDVYDDYAKIRIIGIIADFVEDSKYIEFDDLFGITVRNVDELTSQLSPNGKRVLAGSIADGDNAITARVSEALSFSNFEKRGATLKYTEQMMGSGKKFDFVINLNDENYPVSVKRLITETPSLNNVRDKLLESIGEMSISRNNLPNDLYSEYNVLHYLVKNQREVDIMNQVFLQLIDNGEISDNVKLVITKVPDYIMVGG